MLSNACGPPPLMATAYSKYPRGANCESAKRRAPVFPPAPLRLVGEPVAVEAVWNALRQGDFRDGARLYAGRIKYHERGFRPAVGMRIAHQPARILTTFAGRVDDFADMRAIAKIVSLPGAGFEIEFDDLRTERKAFFMFARRRGRVTEAVFEACLRVGDAGEFDRPVV